MSGDPLLCHSLPGLPHMARGLYIPTTHNRLTLF